MTDAEILQWTRDYVTQNFLYMRRNFSLGDGDSLLATGVIDSLGVMELVGFVEQTFGVTVDPAEITEVNFGSLAGIARYVGTNGPAAAGAGGE